MFELIKLKPCLRCKGKVKIKTELWLSPDRNALDFIVPYIYCPHCGIRYFLGKIYIIKEVILFNLSWLFIRNKTIKKYNKKETL